MHKAGSGVVGDVIAVEEGDGEVVTLSLGERMITCQHRFRRLMSARTFVCFDLRGLKNLFGQSIGQNKFVTNLGPVVLGSFGHLVESVGDALGETDGAVAR